MNTLTIITLCVLVILILGLIMPLRLSWRSKLLLTVVTIVGMSRNYIYLLVGGNSFDPNIPYNLYFVLDLTRATLMTLAILVLCRMTLNGLSKIVKRSTKAFIIPAFSLFHTQIMLLGAFALACYGSSCAYSKPRINHYQVTLERLDPRLDGMRVIMISDFHISALSDPSYVVDIIKKVNGLNPDLILMPGDLIDGQVDKRDALTKLLFELKAKFGVYITTGNHEYYSGYQDWHDYFVQGGLISLDNKVVALKDAKNKTLLTLGGLTDPKAALYNLPMPDVKGVAEALDDSAPTIVLSHRPTYARALANSSKQVDLVLSGHTHGGLILGFNQLVAKLNDGFLSGHYRINNTDLIVSNGLAVWSGYPMRLGVPSEFIVMTLRSKVRPQSYHDNLTAKADQLRKLKNQQKGTLVLSASAPPTTDTNAIKTKQGSVKGLNLILPMVDTESGKTYQSVTRLALLPEDLNADQVKRISEILHERQVAEPKLETNDDNPMSLPKGITLDILKAGANEKAPQAKSQEQKATPAPKKELSTQELLKKEQASEDVTLEIQSEYAISLGNSKDKIDDKKVADLLKKP